MNTAKEIRKKYLYLFLFLNLEVKTVSVMNLYNTKKNIDISNQEKGREKNLVTAYRNLQPNKARKQNKKN